MFCPTGDVSMVVVSQKEAVSNLLEDLRECSFVHLDELLSQVSFDNLQVHPGQSPPTCLDPC